MRAIINILLLYNCLQTVRAWAHSPSDVCTECCCCVVTSAGTRNFCPRDSGGFETDTIPNCYYVQSHLDEVLAQFHGQGDGVFDTYSIPGKFLIWRPTDPAYGCFKDLATVTATNIAEPTALPTAKAGNTLQTSTPGTGQSSVGNSGGCVFNGGNQTGIICGNNTNAQTPHNLAGKVRVN